MSDPHVAPPDADLHAPPLPLTTAEAIHRGSENVVLFGNIFLPRAFRQPSPPFHFELADLLAGPNRYNAFSVFRGGAKTTLLRAFSLQRVAYSLSNTIMVVSATQDHSLLTLAWLKAQAERNRLVRDAFGIRPGKKWAETHIEILTDLAPEPITILAFGITGQIRGFNVDDYRPDLIVADDIQTEENVGTDEQRRKTHSLFFGALVNSLAPVTENPVAKIALLQTPMFRGDVITTCIDDPTWISKVFSVFGPSGESVWSERYPTPALRVEKAAHARRGQFSLWMSEWECEIVRSEFKTFDVANLQYWRELPRQPNDCATGIDPASSEDRHASDNVVLTAMRRGPDVYVAGYVAAKGQMPDKVASDVFTHKFLFNPQRLLVETVAYQKVLKWYIEQEMNRRRLFLPIKEVRDRRAKSDRIIQALAGLVAHRHLWLHESMLELIGQFRQFEPDKDGVFDILDILATLVDDLNLPSAGEDIELSAMIAEEKLAFGDLRFEHTAP